MSILSPERLTQNTAQLAAAYFSKNQVAIADVPTVIAQIAASLRGETAVQAPASKPQEPAVPIKSSIKQDYLICLEDGARLKSLKRYLRGKFNLSPEQYRAKWGLPADYPMVAPSYSAKRSELAKQFGLGRKGASPEAVQDEPATPEPENPEVTAFGESLNAGLAGTHEVSNALVDAAQAAAAEAPAPADPLAFQDDDDTPAAQPVNPDEGPGKLPEGYAGIADTFNVEAGAFTAIICLIDNKPVRDLGRHARKHHGVSAEQYRKMFGLPENYPMTVDRAEAFVEAALA